MARARPWRRGRQRRADPGRHGASELARAADPRRGVADAPRGVPRGRAVTGRAALDMAVPPRSNAWVRSIVRHEAVLTAAALFSIALVIRAAFASQIVFPKPEDTAYYVGVARNLVEGRGLVSDALWSYQTPPLAFPRAAFEVWLPLPSFLAAIPMAILGPTFASAQWVAIVLGAIVPVLGWRLAADVAAERGL